MSAATITQLILLVLGAVGATQITKKAVTAGSTVTLSPIMKQALTLVFGVGLAIVTGDDVNAILPGGMAGDGAVAGIVGTVLYSIISPKKPE